ncbi:hypothetical protein [Dysgonomonas massiliensis]|uniref:hypothetical protein n=1 Tax=Dysgonomonas massiliensis TaxID=2040292 RepID=UPI000C775C69|nr:hypothetical protein [Dysgonomonas massiliensis]
MKGKYFKLFVLVVVVLAFCSCADVENVQECLTNNTYGFWGGLWHGVIAPFSFIGSLFSDDIAIYAVNNNGGFYDFGFVLGSGILFGGIFSNN